MKHSKLLTATIAAGGLALGIAALAQEDATQDPHHPAQRDANALKPPMQSDQSVIMGMMRMMDLAQMIRMMNMMGGDMPVPRMGMEKMDPAGMGMIDHVEGRIAFLRAELKVTDAQAEVWDGFADTLRASANRLNEARETADSKSPLPALRDWRFRSNG